MNHSGPVTLLQSLYLTAAGDNERAIALMHSVSFEGESVPMLHRNVLERQKKVWLAQQYDLARDHGQALSYAEEAVRLFQGVGALNEANRLADFAEKMRYIVRRQGGAAS